MCAPWKVRWTKTIHPTWSLAVLVRWRLIDPKTGMSQATAIIPYGSALFVKDGQKLKKGDVICEWDPFNAVIISEDSGKVAFEGIEQGVTYRVEIDEQTGFQQKVISETRNKKMIPSILIQNTKERL